jgi:TPP-dependent indolepyruvate ferredoxin oxidoreductase alpha subunit
MLMPHEYCGFTIEAFYDEPNENGACTVSVYIEAPSGEFCQQIASGVANWTEAKAQAERAIDELIATTTANG